MSESNHKKSIVMKTIQIGIAMAVAWLPEITKAEVERVPEGLKAGEWSSLRAAYAAGRHAFHQQTDGTVMAQNPGQRWQMKFDGKGFLASPHSGGWEWGLELQGVEVAGEADVVGNRLSFGRGEVLQEWFVNDARGLEQGWTFWRSPAGAKDRLTLELAVKGNLRARVAERQVDLCR
jgi:trimeric autotransporter adhesin